MRSYWSIRLYHNLWDLISKCLMNTNLPKIILDSHLSDFISAGEKVVEVRYPFQARSPAAGPKRDPTVAHIFVGPQPGCESDPPSSPMDVSLLITEPSIQCPHNSLIFDYSPKLTCIDYLHQRTCANCTRSNP